MQSCDRQKICVAEHVGQCNQVAVAGFAAGLAQQWFRASDCYELLPAACAVVLQVYFSGVVAPAVSSSVAEMSSASSALLSLIRAVEDSITVVLRKCVDTFMAEVSSRGGGPGGACELVISITGHCGAKAFFHSCRDSGELTELHTQALLVCVQCQ